jgi:hypothetical protein
MKITLQDSSAGMKIPPLKMLGEFTREVFAAMVLLIIKE